MKKPIPFFTKKILCGSLLLSLGLAQNASAVLFDGGVDSENLGKGDWIYFLSQATNHLGGHVSSVVNIPTLMSYYQSQGIDFIIVKAGTGSTNFNGSGSTPQFTTTLVNEAHAKGIKIMGYTRSYGDNVQGEINIATSCFNKGADGFVIDAEAEWEAGHQGTQGPAKALQLGSGIKNLWPTKFLAHAPFPYITLHSSFPYKEFGFYCDAVMPQDYWFSIGVSPATMVADMSSQWRNWQNSLTGQWVNSKKPIAPVAQADTASIPGSDITAFFNALNNDPNPATPGGYKGITFWRTDLHTTSQWAAISAGTLGGPPPPPENGIVVDNPSATVVGSWSTGSTATDKYGSDYRYIGPGTGSSYLRYTPSIPSAGSYQVYEWHSQGANRATAAPHVITFNGPTTTININQQINGGQWNLLGTFNFLAGTSGNVKITDNFSGASVVAIADAIKFVPVGVSEIIIDNGSATVVGTWSTGSTSTDKFGSDYRYHGPGTGTSYLQYTPNIGTAGTYQVYEWHPEGSNRTTAAKHVVAHSGGTTTINVNQQIGGGQWNLLGTFNFSAGTSGNIKINDNFSAGSVVMADAIRLVFVP